ncbi:MAG: resolvase domain protein [Crocinitomicaceae bacterium]|nr:resolvase domain protein [Crocinitomicaceae bacterium]
MGLEQFKAFAKGGEKKEETNKNVMIYTRVSSKDQENNKSLKTQLEQATKYAEQHGYIITSKFGGTYESASGDVTRKEFMKLINEIRTTKNKPFAILLNTINRFSRTGATSVTLAHELVEKYGVHLIDVTTGKNTITADGRNEIYLELIKSNQENLDRMKNTIPGMEKLIDAGNWLGKAPRGYDLYGTKVKNFKLHHSCQKIVLNDEGKLLQKAWQWKLQGEKDYMIIQRLKDLGLKISKQSLSDVWRNTFYCGISSHKMLKGEVRVGNWEKMVSEQDFLMVQEILKENKFGYKQDKSNPNRPLNGFVKCHECGNKLTGYEVKAKNLHYYKCQGCKGGSINADTTSKSKQEGANDLFFELLQQYELNEALKAAFNAQLKLTYSMLNDESKSDNQILSKELLRLEEDLKKLKRRYALGEIDDKDIFSELKSEYEEKINDFKQKLEMTDSKISNPDNYIKISEEIVSNISNYWDSEDVETKKRIQELVFCAGLSLDLKNRVYLTEKVNVIFSISRDITRVSERANKKRQPISKLPSSVVAGTRLERATFGL